MQAPVKNCKSDAFPVGSHFCLHGERFTVAASWNTGSSGATVNIVERWPSGDFFKEGDLITPRSSCTTCKVHGQYNSRQAPVKNCRADMFPVGSHVCLHGERFTVAASWNTGSSGATVNIEGNWPNGDFFTDDDEITPGC